MSSPSLADVRAARSAIAGEVRETPLIADDRLDESLGARVWVKAEHVQRGGSFKFRGIHHRVLSLTQAERAAGILTVSSGNAAIAAALSARLQGLSCTVIVPEHVVPAKRDVIRELGASVIQRGRGDPEMFAAADELVKSKGFAVVHPFAQPEVVTGHATIGLELAEQAPDPDAVIVPASGGGLLAGVSLALRELNPSLQIIGVQPEGADGLRRSLQAGAVVSCGEVDTLADGLNGDAPGELDLDIIASRVDDVVLVSDDDMLRAMALLWRSMRTVVEPAGAASVAAIGRFDRFRGRRVVAITSGANVDLDLMRHAAAGGSAAEWKRRQPAEETDRAERMGVELL